MKNVVDLKAEHLAELCELYNESIAIVPHCYPASLDRFEKAFGPELGEGPGLERLKAEKVLVAIQDGQVVGFVHLAEHQLKNGSILGGIRFLLYRPGSRPVGQALLGAALEHFAGRKTVFAFHQYYRYEFYHRSCSYLSDRLGHVQSLLQVNGFERDEGEIHFDWDDFEVDPGDAPVNDVVLKTEIEDETDHLPSVRVGVWMGEEEIAACEICSCGRWTREPSVQDRLFVKWLGVEEAYQGRKLGEHTLLYAMQAAREVGYRNAAISTAVNNHRAFVFYSNIGFHVTDMTYLWAKRESQVTGDK